MTLTGSVAEVIKDMAAKLGATTTPDELNEILRLLGKWRSQMLANTYIARQGTYVLQGPFAGMQYVTSATEGALMPRLLGTYESELHPYLRMFAESELDDVIVIGCAEGYYAVGLALLIPGAKVYAYDLEQAAQLACETLAAKNAVGDRVSIGGEFTPEGFETFAGRRVLILIDTEGAEDDILQPRFSPSLSGMSIIVETHDSYRPGVLSRIATRFKTTHHIERVDQQFKNCILPSWLRGFSHLDQLLAVWEWRAIPTPWLVMTPKLQRDASAGRREGEQQKTGAARAN